MRHQRRVVCRHDENAVFSGPFVDALFCPFRPGVPHKERSSLTLLRGVSKVVLASGHLLVETLSAVLKSHQLYLVANNGIQHREMGRLSRPISALHLIWIQSQVCHIRIETDQKQAKPDAIQDLCHEHERRDHLAWFV